MTISLESKRDHKTLNFLFLLIPIFFLSSVSVSNLLCIVYLTTIFYYIKKYNLKIKTDILDLILFLFFCVIIISSLREIFLYNKSQIEILTLEIFEKLSIIRFFFVYFLTKNILLHNLIRFENFFKTSLFCTIFISINIILMHLIGNDIFGNKEIANRFSTIFGERAIAGTYLLNFFFFGLIFFYYLDKQNTLIRFFFIILVGLGILLSFDRMPFLLFLIFFFFICILSIKKDYRLLIIMITILPVFFLIILKYEKLYKRYVVTYIEVIAEKNFRVNKTEDKIINYYSYGSIYKDSINIIFFEKTFIGSGKSSFSSRCKSYRLQTDKKSLKDGYFDACPRHTHNLYLEILVSGGILSFFLFISTIIIKFFLLAKYTFIKNSSYYLVNSILIITLILEVFPFRSYGNIFNSYNGFFFFFKFDFFFLLFN